MSEYAIPTRLNIALSLFVATTAVVLLARSGRHEGIELLGVSVAFGILMNLGYGLIHEAEHGLLHPEPRTNEGLGVALSLLFPAPFHLIRQGHLGHHVRNRSDDEAFDFYFEGESRVWRFMQLYGILTGFFWLVIAFSNVIAAVHPRLLTRRLLPFDRTTCALQSSLNPRYERIIQLEAIAALALHASLIQIFSVPVASYFWVYAGFGLFWSGMQYAHHFGTERDVIRGALNLRTFRWLDAMWLNHNWHANHHKNPGIPWPYLPSLSASGDSRGSLFLAYLRMWRGPRAAASRAKALVPDRATP